jgi:hypothetical protein
VRQGAGWTVHRRRSRCPARPVSSPSGVQPVHCPVIWLPRPDAAGRPGGVQPVRCPAGWCPPGWCPSPSGRPAVCCLPSPCRIRLVPRQPVVAMGDTRYGGAAVTTGSSRVPCVRPHSRRLGRRPDEAEMRAPLRGSCEGRRGSVGRRTWAGWCFGGRLRPTDQAGQTAARGARRWRLRSAGAG